MNEKKQPEKRRSFKVDENEYKEIMRLREIKKEDKQRNRLYTIESNKRRITYGEREIKHKQEQIDKGKSLEKHANYFDGKKPLFMVQNDIEEILNQMKQLKEINELAQKEYDDNRD